MAESNFDLQIAAKHIAQELGVSAVSVERTLALFAEGATIPFIARYRKEATTGLDEVQIASIETRFEAYVTLEERREAVIASVKEQEKLTSALEKAMRGASTLNALEDLYLPYKPRRRTRGQKAREAGLDALAEAIKKGDDEALKALLASSKSEEFPDADAILGGARDIIAEELSESANLRERLRERVIRRAHVATKAKKDGDPEGKFQSLLEIDESPQQMAGHRVLGLFRAEREGALTVKLSTDDALAEEETLNELPETRSERAEAELTLAAADAWKRLLKPSLDTELRAALKERADDEAIEVFATNLRKVLLAPPLGEHGVVGVDPGFRSGCKIALVDPQGAFVTNTTIFPHAPQNASAQADTTLKALLERFGAEFPIRFFAFGNGTASRETEGYLKAFIAQMGKKSGLEAIQVSESGASIYSASEIAREEFPELDLTVRGAISIARRLQDPLSELIKLDPKSIGVGQYQHDVDQKKLAKALDRVVESCVNSVGINLNTASWALLRYVSGISPKLAKAIVEHRTKHGRFASRKELLKVAGLGPKAYELCAGFLRIRGGDNLLDATAVHPERYDLVGTICRSAKVTLKDLVEKPALLDGLKPSDFVDSKSGAGLPTIEDIFSELRRPGRDPRGVFEAFSYDERVQEIGDLTVGMKLPGIVTNVTNFGCFVDVGVHQDGLVHISELATRFVKDPNEVVSVGDRVKVEVLSVDVKRRRIALSRKSLLSFLGALLLVSLV